MSARTDHEAIIRRFPTVESVSRRPGPGRVDHVSRRIGLLLLVLVVVGGSLGYAGPRSTTASESGPGGSLEVEYPSLTRPGLDTEVSISVVPDRSTETLRLSVSQATLARLGVERFSPEPQVQRTEADRVVLEFATEPGPSREFTVRMSGRTPTTQMPGRHRWELDWLPWDGAGIRVAATTWTVP
ncbi:hypothetical protein [Nocardioides jishulii]|uniref:Uncharacterized protein n=1 Tax=Nocardioides jishulii TaxID=2575440 RepID=A0A4U2YM74_9ACTN|nr:hypothetical protein [Nocardioides jishulii]QCX27542.1 hypothetical protein FCL41_08410 [Nocardioides jishulii]TKI62349.1 hypothetical protein FC770_08075 [Nocardioides jishulii]